MTISKGFYCSVCRVKYVEHKCKNNTLPCGHDYEKSVYVWSQRFGGETTHVLVRMQAKGLSFHMNDTPENIRSYFEDAQNKNVRYIIDGFLPSKKKVALFAEAFEHWRSSVDEKRMLYYPRLKEAKAEKPVEGDGQS